MLVDFSKAPDDVLDYFVDLRNDLDAFFMYLSSFYGVELHRRDSLIIFDEVQLYPKAREAIKQLVADGRYDYIETGSLVSIRENVKDILIPSEEESIRLNPMDFDEFLWALGEKPLSTLIADSFKKRRPLPDSLHRKAMRLFREYMLVGGMPQAVSKYVETHDFSKVDNVKRNILRLYRQDISKHGGSDRIRITRIFDNLVGQLSKKEKKFNITSLGKAAKTRDYEDAFFWLSDAFITNDCFNSTDPSVGLSISETIRRSNATPPTPDFSPLSPWPTRNRPEATYTGTSSWNASKSTRACSRRTSSHSFSGPTGTGCSSTRAATATTRRTVWRSTSSLSNRMRTRR